MFLEKVRDELGPPQGIFPAQEMVRRLALILGLVAFGPVPPVRLPASPA